jgi:FADH2 O2-dependent halogenase
MTDERTSARTTYDVAILGSGIGGSTLACCLARNGVRVLLIDAAQHPRFAIGESTTPYTLVSLRRMADRYMVPELKALTALKYNNKVIKPNFGIKRHFGFLIHHEGQPQNPKESNQFATPGLLHESSHLFRQDTDSFVFHLAVKYGADAKQGVKVVDVDIDDSGVTIHGHDGSEYRARYVVDAGGFRSPLAEKFGLRENPPRFKHHSRSLWTHAVGVTPTDDLWDRSGPDVPHAPWYWGTVHHCFERGWFWVIAFNNHPSSRNPVVSVGLTLDERRYPKDPNLTPEEDFFKHAARFPDVERQYAGMVPVREWNSTERLQYSTSQTVGDRWCILGHAAGFIDPLYSFGLSNTFEAINAIAWRLIDAVKDDDFSAERFEYLDRLQQGLLHYNDLVVNASYISWDNFDLWNAVFRIWAWGSNVGTFRQQEGLKKFWKDGRVSHLTDLEEQPYLGLPWPDHEGYKKIYDEMVAQCDAYEAGAVTGDQAADVLWKMLEESDFFPRPFGFIDRNNRYMNPKPITFAKTGLWAVTEAEPQIRKLLLSTGRQAIKLKLQGRRIF